MLQIVGLILFYIVFIEAMIALTVYLFVLMKDAIKSRKKPSRHDTIDTQ